MKIGLITDLHFGYNKSSQFMLDYQLDFLQHHFISYLNENKIDCVIILGDMWHDRKHVNANAYHHVKKRFLDLLKKINIYLLAGNHDLFHTNSSDVSSLEMVEQYQNINVVYEPKMVNLGSTKLSLIPWVSNRSDLNKLQTFLTDPANSHSIMLGHLELDGFRVNEGFIHTGSHFPRELLNGFKTVYSGHFHNRQQQDHIIYLGTPYDLSWNEVDVPKGFYVFDTETQELESIENRNKLHINIIYDDLNPVDQGALTDLKGKNVRVYIKNKTSKERFNDFVFLIESSGVNDFEIRHEDRPINLELDMDLDKNPDELKNSNLNTHLETYVNDVFTTADIKDKPTLLKLLKKLLVETSQ